MDTNEGAEKMTWKELVEATGWTPSADDMHDSLFAPKHEGPREVKGSYADTPSRSAGFDRRRGSYR